mmetsp:Transcript_23085/g.65039  ORF Transcript_23085/g.65039 Transcript_23085/m.65039 type:complete len:353 (-) Transcript_23085:563-1621(-)
MSSLPVNVLTAASGSNSRKASHRRYATSRRAAVDDDARGGAHAVDDAVGKPMAGAVSDGEDSRGTAASECRCTHGQAAVHVATVAILRSSKAIPDYRALHLGAILCERPRGDERRRRVLSPGRRSPRGLRRQPCSRHRCWRGKIRGGGPRQQPLLHRRTTDALGRLNICHSFCRGRGGLVVTDRTGREHGAPDGARTACHHDLPVGICRRWQVTRTGDHDARCSEQRLNRARSSDLLQARRCRRPRARGRPRHPRRRSNRHHRWCRRLFQGHGRHGHEDTLGGGDGGAGACRGRQRRSAAAERGTHQHHAGVQVRPVQVFGCGRRPAEERTATNDDLWAQRCDRGAADATGG